MSELREFTSTAARPLPVIFLLDVSGSMAEEGKINVLNQSMRDMLATFSKSDDLRAEIHIAVITFGGEARLHAPLQPAARLEWQDFVAEGGTPMGAAMSLAADLIEDKEAIPGRAYRPTVVLVSDGHPTDQFSTALDKIAGQGRAQKADRMALAIGSDADVDLLRRFVSNPERTVFLAADARRIKDFFQLVTMSVAARSRSISPNDVPKLQDPFNLDQI